MDPRRQKIIKAIRTDYQSGAAQLATRALQLVQDWLESGTVSGEEVEQLLDELTRARPSMVALENAMVRCRQHFPRWSDPGNVSRQALPIVHEVLDQLASVNQRVAAQAMDLIPENATVLTHSRSSQVLGLFRALAEQHRPFSVICTQSSPGNEGFTLAQELNDLAVPVTVITDAQMGLFVGEADLILCGCDTWLSDGYFLNKSGTGLLAFAAADKSKPFWVLADSFKDSQADSKNIKLEEMAGDELGGPSGDHITLRNIYFEPVPVSLITGRVSEQGVFSFPAGHRL